MFNSLAVDSVTGVVTAKTSMQPNTPGPGMNIKFEVTGVVTAKTSMQRSGSGIYCIM
jgi:hypothetical protein